MMRVQRVRRLIRSFLRSSRIVRRCDWSVWVLPSSIRSTHTLSQRRAYLAGMRCRNATGAIRSIREGGNPWVPVNEQCDDRPSIFAWPERLEFCYQW